MYSGVKPVCNSSRHTTINFLRTDIALNCHAVQPQPFYDPFFQCHPGEPAPEANFWTLWCKRRLTEADTPTIQVPCLRWVMMKHYITLVTPALCISDWLTTPYSCVSLLISFIHSGTTKTQLWTTVSQKGVKYFPSSVATRLRCGGIFTEICSKVSWQKNSENWSAFCEVTSKSIEARLKTQSGQRPRCYCACMYYTGHL